MLAACPGENLVCSALRCNASLRLSEVYVRTPVSPGALTVTTQSAACGTAGLSTLSSQRTFATASLPLTHTSRELVPAELCHSQAPSVSAGTIHCCPPCPQPWQLTKGTSGIWARKCQGPMRSPSPTLFLQAKSTLMPVAISQGAVPLLKDCRRLAVNFVRSRGDSRKPRSKTDFVQFAVWEPAAELFEGFRWCVRQPGLQPHTPHPTSSRAAAI